MWFASLSSFGGIVSGASHYFVDLIRDSDGFLVQVQWRIDQETTDQWNSADPSFEWKVGALSSKFNSREEAERAAVAAWRHVANPAADLLLGGNRANMDPQTVLAAPPEIIDQLTRLHKQARANKWWDMPLRMKRICDQWDAYIAPWRTSQKQYDRRDRGRVVLERSPDDNQSFIPSANQREEDA